MARPACDRFFLLSVRGTSMNPSGIRWNRWSWLPYRESDAAARDTVCLRGFDREKVLATREPVDRNLDWVVRRMVGESIGGKFGDVVKHHVIGRIGNARRDGRRECGCFGILIDP